jgi:N-acyl-D-aspartate/D-glutamate deacylase
MPFDFAIRGATIYDGSGMLAFIGDLAVLIYTVLGQSDEGAHLAIDAGFAYCTELLAHCAGARRFDLEAAIRKLTGMQAQM